MTAVVVTGLVLAACGSDDDATEDTSAAPMTEAPAASSPADSAPAEAADGPVVVASTSWVAAIAELAGADDVTFIAPNSVQHPPDYEPTASDLAAVSDADFVVVAGFEGFAEQLTEASGSGAEVVNVMPSYDPTTLRAEVDKLAALWGTEDEAADNLAAYDAGYEQASSDLQAVTGESDDVVVAQAFAVEWAALAGLDVAGTYGPAPATATEIADLADLDPTLVFDNVHMGGGAEIADASGATLVALANFPGDDLDLLAVVDANAALIADAVGATIDAPDAEPTATVYPLTITNCGREVTFEQAPERVLILNGTSVAEVESFLVLGIEDSILANSQSYGVSDVEGIVDQIAALPDGGMSLNENFEVPKEEVLALEPDLVISTWAGGFSEAMGSATRDQLAEVGINTYVTPVNCAYGDENASAEDIAINESQTYESSFQLLRELGVIFDVQDTAEEVIADAEARIAEASQPAGDDPVNVLVAYPGMAMMSADGVPAVFGGPFADSIIEAAGGVNSFAGLPDFAASSSINAEALAAADVDVLVIGLFMADEDAEAYAEQIFAQYPQWNAAQTNTWTTVAESFYLGPFNAVAIEKIGDAIAGLG